MILKNGRLLDPKSRTDKVCDLRIEAGKVSDIAAANALRPTGQEEVIDATGKWVLPGLIDLHVHLREPGEEYKEDIATGSRAAAAGGFTTIVAMPNTKPVCDNAEITRFVLEKAAGAGLCRVLPMGAITVGQAGEVLAPLGELKRAGCVAVTDDGHYVHNAGIMRSALEYARDFDLLVATHAEDTCLSRRGFMHEGAVSTRLGLRGYPRIAEDVAVSRDLMLAEYTGGKLHVCHVSSGGAVDLIRKAKARGVRVTAEVAPHHFTLTHERVIGYDTNAKMNPPLRESADCQALIEGLRDGTLDAIATDHAPHSLLEKDTPFDEAANGIIGLETALPLTLELVRQGVLPLLVAVERLTLGPARVLDRPYGTIEKGGAADLTVVDPDAQWQVTRETLASKSKNTPFLGQTLTGQVVTTLLGGVVTFRRDTKQN